MLAQRKTRMCSLCSQQVIVFSAVYRLSCIVDWSQGLCCFQVELKHRIEMTEDGIGLAFSGGGIRSAALSSGVLRRLLHREVNVDYISCVSGGNYTAAAYLDWKYRNNNADHANWHKTFFEYMRSRAGYVCNWERPLQGILDTVILVSLLITINLVIPCVMYSSGAFTAAFVINYVFGSILCVDVQLNTTGSTVNTSATIPPCTSGYDRGDSKARQQLLLFVLLSIFFIVCYTIKVMAPFHRIISPGARFLQILTGVLFAFTFIPWLIHQFVNVLSPWLNICVFVLSIFFWLGFPPLRRKASLAFVLYFYAFVIKWRVYQTKVMGIPYNDHLFYTLLLVSSGLIWISPYLGMFSTTSIFTYYKWRLQKAFFHEDSVGSSGCRGISCRDFFPILSCCRHDHDLSKYPLLMENLREVTPEYISNVAVDYWCLKPSLRDQSYAVMSMSPNENERIDHQPGESDDEVRLSLGNVYQADAMVTSAAVMALSPEQDEPFRDLQIMLGLTLRKGFRLKKEKTGNPDETMRCSSLVSKIFAVLIQSIAAFPVMFLAVIALTHWDMKDKEGYAVAVSVAYFVVFVAIAIMPTGGTPPWFFDKYVRWCHVHMYHVRFLREVFKVNNVGPNPPAILSLSDGGRLEKYGLLYLLKKRLKKILVVDGSFIRSDADYSKYILKSMDQAREKLNCEFVGLGGRDVKEQMRKEYVDVPSGRQPRHFRFSVKYFEKRADGGFFEVGTGEIMIIAPRHPSKGASPTEDMGTTWADYGEELDRDDWGDGPVLQRDEVNRLTFCCCESCHTTRDICSEISRKLCLGFPHTSTLNQFFTPSLFTAYHREGYRACVESGAEEFLTGREAVELGNVV